MPEPSVPRASRPEPSLYFMEAEGGSGLLPWSHVDGALAAARNYWLATSGRDGRPHCMPVWGVWDGETFTFSTSGRSRKARNLDHNPWAVVHLESGARVVVLEGPVVRVTDREALQTFLDVYNPKYAWDFTLDRLAGDPVFAVRPAKAFAWLGDEGEAFSGTATRWTFDAG